MGIILHVPGLSGAKQATNTVYIAAAVRQAIAGFTQIIHRALAKPGTGVS
jgi:hypothetical protein